MIILDVNKLSKNFGYGQLFSDVSFSLNEGESISIVGPNGCGKSTLLKMIAGLEKVDSRMVSIKKDSRVAYLDQTGSSINDDRLVYDILKEGFGELTEMERRLNELQKMLETDLEECKYNSVLEKYCSLMEKFSVSGGYDMDVNINTVMEGLNIDKNLLHQSYNDLSGGEKTLVQLAKTLLIKPDLILLDEPTNHLDIDRIEWLESYIKSFKGASVIVSHDRYFLDRMSNKILAIGNNGTKVYATNYSGYLVEEQRNFEQQMTEYGDQQAAIKQLETKAKEFMNLGMGRNSSALTKQGKTLWERAQRMRKSAIQKPKKQKRLNVGFTEERKSSKKKIVSEGLTVSTPDGRKILDNIDLDICAGE
ncbi:MAG: ATP-binding cassette domain-containing protein, partial [Clostridia bacterium]|nr:ATP-binding cassette domain-containing protein [Clostridia bacterium]